MMLHAPFLDQATRHPDRIALIDRDRRVSYATLLDRARRKAAAIDFHCGASRRPVAIVGDKRVEAVEAILGTLISGRPYSYLHPAQRRARIACMLETLRPELILDLGSAQPDYSPNMLRGLAPTLPVDGMSDHGALQPMPQPAAIAYVLFTSGSSGIPKGVAISHSAARAAQSAYLQTVGLTRDDIVANEVALCFDVSTFDLFAGLSVGATIDLTPESYLDTPQRLLEHLRRERVTSLFTVPTVARLLFDSALPVDAVSALPDLRRLQLTGEVIPKALVPYLDQLIAAGTEVHNLYGMTEAPWALAAKLKPADHQRPNILDPDATGDPVRVGLQTSGEIVLHGPGLFSGYVTPDTDYGSPWPACDRYATGDLAERMTSGRYLFLGRHDRQIRYHGHRTELGEIEGWLERHPAVGLAYVTYDEAAERIVAYISPRSPTAPGLDAVRRHAATVLPSYMVPHQFILLERAPRTATGKKDYAGLPAEADA